MIVAALAFSVFLNFILFLKLGLVNIDARYWEKRAKHWKDSHKKALDGWDRSLEKYDELSKMVTPKTLDDVIDEWSNHDKKEKKLLN